MSRIIRSALLLLTSASPGVLLGQTPQCAPFPTGFMPFAAIYTVFGTPGNNQLVAGVPGSGGYDSITLQLPLPAAPGQMFCGNSIELAPGRFFEGVYVPTAREREGDYSQSTDVAGRVITLYDPLSGGQTSGPVPFPANIVPASRLNGLFAIRVVASLASLTAPAIVPGGITTAAGASGVAVGGLISIFGTNLASATRAVSTTPVLYLYEDTQVRIGGSFAPLLWVSPGQINAQLPFQVAYGTQTVVVTRAGLTSTNFSLPVYTAAPAIFDGAFLKNADYSIVSAQNPARAGDVLLIYCTGLGAVAPPVAAGIVTPSSPLSAPVAAPRVTIGGLDAQVIYALLSPGFLGLYQIAVVTPEGLPPGPSPVVITSGGATSVPDNVVIGPG